MWSWQNGAPLIEISQSVWRETAADLRPMLALHELLGAYLLRLSKTVDIDYIYSDDDYELASVLWLFSQPLSNGLNQREKNQILDDTVHTYILAGGIAGVGGGGDRDAVWYKKTILSKSLQALSESRGQRRQNYVLKIIDIIKSRYENLL